MSNDKKIKDNEGLKIIIPSNYRTEFHTSLAPIASTGNVNRATHFRKSRYAKVVLRITGV